MEEFKLSKGLGLVQGHVTNLQWSWHGWWAYGPWSSASSWLFLLDRYQRQTRLLLSLSKNDREIPSVIWLADSLIPFRSFSSYVVSVWTNRFLKFHFSYLKELYGEKEGGKERKKEAMSESQCVSHLLIHSQNGCSKSWTNLKPGARNFLWVSPMGAGPQELVPYPTAFPGHPQGAGLEV